MSGVFFLETVRPCRADGHWVWHSPLHQLREGQVGVQPAGLGGGTYSWTVSGGGKQSHTQRKRFCVSEGLTKAKMTELWF